DALGLERLFGPEPREPAPLLRDATRVVSWFGARDPDFVRRLTALVPDTVVVRSVGEARPVWEHLLASVGAPMEDAARWREPVVPAPTLVDEGRRALRDVGWDGRTPLVVVHPGAGGVLKRWPAEGFAAVLERLRSERALVLAIHQGPADADAVAAARTGRSRSRLDRAALVWPGRTRGPSSCITSRAPAALCGRLRLMNLVRHAPCQGRVTGN